jgi:hypothetical protein
MMFALALSALLLATVAPTASYAADVPHLDIRASCRDAMKASVGIIQDMDACLASENGAREQLAKEWSSFGAADRTSCLSLTRTGTSGTYTELLTCLEMKRDARKLPNESQPDTIGRGM